MTSDEGRSYSPLAFFEEGARLSARDGTAAGRFSNITDARGEVASDFERLRSTLCAHPRFHAPVDGAYGRRADVIQRNNHGRLLSHRGDGVTGRLINRACDSARFR